MLVSRIWGQVKSNYSFKIMISCNRTKSYSNQRFSVKFFFLIINYLSLHPGLIIASSVDSRNHLNRAVIHKWEKRNSCEPSYQNDSKSTSSTLSCGHKTTENKTEHSAVLTCLTYGQSSWFNNKKKKRAKWPLWGNSKFKTSAEQKHQKSSLTFAKNMLA